MLYYLHIKNYALIDDAEVEFSEGLNILTGETGAGKSLLLGSISLALGAKTKSDVIREGQESAFVEMHFGIDNDAQRKLLREMDIEPEDDTVIISRKITHQRSVGKICGETVNTSDLRAVATAFLDVYGQHDYQELLKESSHIDLLDGFANEQADALKAEVSSDYETYSALKHEIDGLETDEGKRIKEMDILRFQLDEIKAANLKEGEEEDLKEYLRLAENGERIAESLSKAGMFLSEDNGALGNLSHAFREIGSVSSLSGDVAEFEESLNQAQDILKTTARSMEDYLENLDFDEQTLKESRERYDFICSLMMKYGKTVADVQRFYDEKNAEYEKLCDFEDYKNSLDLKLKKAEEKLSADCKNLTNLRKDAAKKFEEKMTQALSELNFNHAEFEVRITENDRYTAKGRDNVRFYISTNAGESLKPLNEVASGGELSRIMLAIKTLSAKDSVQTLIFDEIDAGISGATAWKVSEKLGELGKNYQVLCITHLPQIAAMADTHFAIEKEECDGRTVTNVKKLFQYESLEEVTRLLSGGQKTEAALQNAKEMIAMAKKVKKQ